jgi:RNA methyltransferase, TrmH family
MLEFRMKSITSRQNPTVRAFRDLADAPDPAGARLLLDGVHLVRDAQAAGAAFELVAVEGSRLESDTEEAALARSFASRGVEVVSASSAAIAAMSPVTTASRIVAIARRQPVSTASIFAAADALVVVVVDVQDPGNLGALIRTAEAGGAGGVLVSGASANPFSWKSLRGSMGSALRVPIASGLRVDDVLREAAAAGARTIATAPRDGRGPDEVEWTGRVALLLGGEGPGLAPAVAAACDQRVTIPMAAAVESLNVAVAAGILIYAARRQRS